MQVINEQNELLIKFEKNILNNEEFIGLIEFIKNKEIIYKSKLTQNDVELLDKELKQKWWSKNKENILRKINDSN